MKVYIAGPIAGYPSGNTEAFQKAADYQRSLGNYPVNPHDVLPHEHPGRNCPAGPKAGGMADGSPSEHTAPCFMRTDMKALLACDAVYMLNGWEQSSGARTEFEVARAAGLWLTYQPQARGFALDAEHLDRQRSWSREAFGPSDRQLGVIDHIRKELEEVITAEPDEALGEWVDVVILALDGAWRSGAEPQEILNAIAAKQATNESRIWPDWRASDGSTAIEHVRTSTHRNAGLLRELGHDL